MVLIAHLEAPSQTTGTPSRGRPSPVTLSVMNDFEIDVGQKIGIAVWHSSSAVADTDDGRALDGENQVCYFGPPDVFHTKVLKHSATTSRHTRGVLELLCFHLTLTNQPRESPRMTLARPLVSMVEASLPTIWRCRSSVLSIMNGVWKCRISSAAEVLFGCNFERA